MKIAIFKYGERNQLNLILAIERIRKIINVYKISIKYAYF